MKKPSFIFVGSGEYGKACLASLLQHKQRPQAVVVANNPSSKLLFEFAQKSNLHPTYTSKSLEELETAILNLKPSCAFIASFPFLIPKTILCLLSKRFINLHPSLLPKYRGCHPLQWALINGETITGVTAHLVEEKLDTGPIITQTSFGIEETDDINSLLRKSGSHASILICEILDRLGQGKRLPIKLQPNGGASFAPCRKPDDSKLSWNDTSGNIKNFIRALKNPYPNAYSQNANGNVVSFSDYFHPKTPGQVLAQVNGLYLISTKDGVILVKTDKSLKIGERLR